MKKILLVALTAILLAILGAVGYDAHITRQFTKLQSSPFANWNDILYHKLENDLLIFGSSRAYVQFDPAILDSILHINSYNLGCNGRQISSQLMKYRIYRQEQKSKPKTILVELSANAFCTYKNYQPIQFIPYLHNRNVWKEVYERQNLSWKDRYIPCYRYRDYKEEVRCLQRGKSYYQKPHNKCYKGYCGIHKQWNKSSFNPEMRLSYYHEPTVIQEFKDFLQQCHEEQIQVIFVLSPLYIGATRNTRNLQWMHQLFENLAAPYQISILDYTEDPLCSDTTNFYNYAHLNHKGATLFTTKLAHDLDSLQLLK